MTRIDGNLGFGGMDRLAGNSSASAKTGVPETTEGRFGDILKSSINQINEMQIEAEQAIEALATGKTDNVAEVMTAVQKSELAFDTLLQIRNKLLEAYNEVRQMPL